MSSLRIDMKKVMGVFSEIEKNRKRIEKSFNDSEHPREENGQFTSGGGINKREAWDSSTDKAKELKAEDWGTPQEIIEMATMPRTAKNRPEAVEILKKIIGEKNIKSISGVIAYIPKSNIGKIVSRQAINTSLSEQAHYHAVANIDKLFSNAIEPWKFELNPNKNNENLKDRKYLYAPMEYQGRIIPVKITVKEKNNNDEKREQIYTIEAIDIEINTKNKECLDKVEDGVITKTIALYTPRNGIPHGVFNLEQNISPSKNLSRMFNSVNRNYLEKSKSTTRREGMRLMIKRRDMRELMKALSGVEDKQLEYFKAKIHEHLDKLERHEKSSIKKALMHAEELAKGRGLPVGTIRTWKGKKYVKLANNKWARKYDKEEKGIKQSLTALRKKVDNALTCEELMRIVLLHRDRFTDNNGHPLPIVQELSRYIRKQGDKLEQGEALEQGEKESGQAVAKQKEKESRQATAKKERKSERKSNDGINQEQQTEIKKKLEDLAVPMMEVEYSKENYDRLFPKGIVKTPLGEVKIGEHQYRKLETKDEGNRQHLLGAMYQTLADPIVIVKQHREKDSGKESYMYAKSFTRKNGDHYDVIISVVVNQKENTEVVKVTITTHQRNLKDVLKAIKNPEDIVYEKTDNPGLDSGDPDVNSSSSASFTPHALTGMKENIKEERHSTPILSPDSSEKSRENSEAMTIEDIRENYQAAHAVSGDKDEIAVGNKTVTGRWKLVEADTPTASHDEMTFHKTKGFPTNPDGSTINDRDYEHDKAAQEAVISIASSYDMRALSFDSPVTLTKDGIVVSGNNRTMSSKIAARNNTDTKYIEALKKKAPRYGFSEQDIAQFDHPRMIFELDLNNGYSTEQFAQFNQSEKKAMNPIENAVKVSKTIKFKTIEHIAHKMTDYDTLGELYADKKAVDAIFTTLQVDGIIGQYDIPQYVTADGITGAGKEFLETVLIGSLVNENNIRRLNKEGCKSIRQKLVRALTPLVENKSLKGGYGITKELNEAIDVLLQCVIESQKDGKKYIVENFAEQHGLFGEQASKVSLELAKKLEHETQKGFADFMLKLNVGLRPSADGEIDVFIGEIESKEAILKRMLNIQKAVTRALVFFKALHHNRHSGEVS